MAITRAQQVRQMLREGSMKPVEQAGVMNYMPSEMVTVPKIAKSSPDTPTAKLAYITPEEQDILIDLNLYGSLDGKPNRGPGGIPSLEGDFGSPTGQASTGAGTGGTYSGGSGDEKAGGNQNTQYTDRIMDVAERKRRQDLRDLATRQAEDKAQEPFETLMVKDSNFPGFIGMGLDALKKPRQKLLDRNVDFYRFSPKTRKARERYGLTAQGYKNYMSARLAGTIDAAGNPLNQDDDDNNIILPMDTTFTQAPMTTDPVVDESETEEPFQLSRRFRAEGGIMNADIVGGEFDFESARQMYGLGKLVKKVTRTVKKIAKSPVGKAAILGAGIYGLGGGTFFGKTLPGVGTGGGFSFRNILPNLIGVKETGGVGVGFEGILGKIGLTKGGGSLMPTVGGAITAVSLLPLLGLGTGEEDEDEAQEILRGEGLDLEAIRANPNQYLGRRFRAEGGSMKEPVAKKTMPLLDLDGKEMDLRAEGGFVPIGRMEKADDVPARLSKNEFVFTADAVRNAGDGDVDKGAEVMYNMMKNLESGGDVSEESQGLEGARKMFQTSQRLEEVL